MGGTDTARLRGTFTQAKKGNRLAVLLAVGAGLGIAALPLMNKRVYETEQKMAALRDGQYDAQAAKAEARNQRLQGPAGPLAKRQAEDK